MTIKNGFLLRKVAGQNVVLPEGETLALNVMITLNETGTFLWERMQTEVDEEMLVHDLLQEYDVDLETAATAVNTFVGKLKDNGILTE